MESRPIGLWFLPFPFPLLASFSIQTKSVSKSISVSAYSRIYSREDDVQLPCPRSLTEPSVSQRKNRKNDIGFESCVDSWLLCFSRSLDLPSSASLHYPLLPFPEQMSGLLCRALSSCCEHICSKSEPFAPLHLEG